jgi:hypothetical protein
MSGPRFLPYDRTAIPHLQNILIDQEDAFLIAVLRHYLMQYLDRARRERNFPHVTVLGDRTRGATGDGLIVDKINVGPSQPDNLSLAHSRQDGESHNWS